MRELTSSEQNLAELLCDERWHKDNDHYAEGDETACLTCRADIVRLVDGAAPRRWEDDPVVKAARMAAHDVFCDSAEMVGNERAHHEALDALCAAVATCEWIRREGGR